jgi:hypothetical protein
VKVADFKPAEAGVKLIAPVVQLVPAGSATLEQLPGAWKKSVGSESLKGDAANVTVPPFAVKVTVPHVPEVLMP